MSNNSSLINHFISHTEREGNQKWTQIEITYLIFFVNKLSTVWTEILLKYGNYFKNRKASGVKNKYARIKKKISIRNMFLSLSYLIKKKFLKTILQKEAYF